MWEKSDFTAYFALPAGVARSTLSAYFATCRTTRDLERSSLSRDRPLRDGTARRRRAAHAVLGNLRERGWRAARLPARRAGRRLPAAPSPLLRSRVLAHRAVRPARRGALDALRRDHRQHDAASRRRPRAAAPPSRNRALAALRRIVGFDAGARLRRGAPGALPRPRAARDLPRPAVRARLVHARHALRVSRSLARLPRVPAAGRARRSARQLLPPPRASRSRRAHAGRAGVGSLRRRLLQAPAADRSAAEVRQRCVGARHRAHRGSLFRPSRRSSGRTSSSQTSGASGTSPARSSRDATTSSVRR